MAKTPLHPSPPPYEVNDVAIVGGGTVLWFLAFLALLPFDDSLSAGGHHYWPWICLSGAGLGLIGLWYCRARQAAIRRSEAAGAAGPQAAPTAD
ncbi:hypothetical protein CFP65_4411 [Kitasatospora sp. MMS16-BH015]|uniref:DUF2530 domain-containing protein n=1 Tax=Kitasatospora sp. MMS16-BH015 TaxID=2018025 RepID=UPI000CA3C650|nr:DUF2530 domain-containing protein [Kitasatospora sp. MMS16-BH015]AUG79160.1 hypothetical protein CFP65_4411 [Kitasatospora sp. MMS16-BH015]